MIQTVINFFKTEFEQFVTFGRIEWQKVLTYRVSVLMYRLAEVLESFILVSMWIFIFAQGTGLIKGYTLNEMVTYVLVGSLCAAVTRNFVHSGISRDIDHGDLSLFLVKPVSYIKFQIYSEFGGVILTYFVSLVTQLCVIVFFFDKFILNTNTISILLIFVMLILAFFIELRVGILIGFMAFWTDGEVGAFQNIAAICKKFFAGGYFPLSLLPGSLALIGYYLPFAYSFFVPAQLYLGKIDNATAIKGLGIQLIWIFILSIILRIVWGLGLKKYEATGS